MAVAEYNATIRREIETKEFLSSILRYNHETGNLFWINGFNGKARREAKAGTVIKKNPKTDYPGFIKLTIMRLDFKAHRIAWILYGGHAPESNQCIDHINGNPLDNRISNLRLSSSKENSRNSKKPKNNSSGYKGVASAKGSPRYRAYICVNRRQLHLGMFDTKESAQEAYNAAAIKHFGEFSCLDR